MAAMTIYRTAYFFFRGIINKYELHQNNMWLNFVLSQLGTCAAMIVALPIHTLRDRLNYDGALPLAESLYSGPIDCLVKIVKDEGVGALWASAPVTLAAALMRSTIAVIWSLMEA